MTTKLNMKDYIGVLKFYKMAIPKSKKKLQIQAENILSNKLCRCIKKVSEKMPDKDKKVEGRSIAICTKSIFNRKNIKRGKFNCKGNQSVKIYKSVASSKTRKNK